MRQLVIDQIRASGWYQKCIENGLSDELPVLEKETDEDLLSLFIEIYG